MAGKTGPQGLALLRQAGQTSIPGAEAAIKARLAGFPAEIDVAAGDEVAAWNTVEGALAAGADPSGIELVLLAPAPRSIGDRWEGGGLAGADEPPASGGRRAGV